MCPGFPNQRDRFKSGVPLQIKMCSMKKYICEVIQDGEDQLLQFTDEFCQENDWRPDDTISFSVVDDDTVTMVNLTKRERDESLHRTI